MKFIHLSDLHLGKRVNEFPMLDDQQYILKEILAIIKDEDPDGVLIAGDVYDRAIPSEEAMKLWDDFLISLAQKEVPVYAISGNHDSAVRFSDHGALVEKTGIHLSPVYYGSAGKYTLNDEFGNLNIYLLPFVKPPMVRALFPQEEIETYTDACRAAIEHMGVDERERNIIVSHQFVTGAVRCDSEEISVGGLDNVDVAVYDAFDYVALGHIHGAQSVGRETVRYCGTPLKYSLSEKDHKKSVTVVEMGKKGDVIIREISLIPMHDMRQITGSYDELMLRDNYEKTATDDYIHAVLTDEDIVIDAMAKMRVVYKNLMGISYRNTRTERDQVVADAMDVEKKSTLELFEEFFEKQNNKEMTDEQRQFVTELIREIWK